MDAHFRGGLNHLTGESLRSTRNGNRSNVGADSIPSRGRSLTLRSASHPLDGARRSASGCIPSTRSCDHSRFRRDPIPSMVLAEALRGASHPRDRAIIHASDGIRSNRLCNHSRFGVHPIHSVVQSLTLRSASDPLEGARRSASGCIRSSRLCKHSRFGCIGCAGSYGGMREGGIAGGRGASDGGRVKAGWVCQVIWLYASPRHKLQRHWFRANRNSRRPATRDPKAMQG